MSKKIGVIAEDQSDIEVIAEFLEKYTPKNNFSIRRFVGNGCGKLRNKCAVWTETLFSCGCDHVLLFHDLDRNNEPDLREILQKKIPLKHFPQSLIVIPIEEIEAWLLSDEVALQKIFSMKTMPKRYNNCEAVNSPKEEIERVVWKNEKKRYLNTVHNKKIAAKVSLDNLRRCPSYLSFDNYVTEMIFPT